MDTTIDLNLTINEAQVLVQLIDIAVKTQGLRAAEAGFVLAKKIEEKVTEKAQTTQQPGNFQPPQAFSPTP
jgi:hypothetical protein